VVQHDVIERFVVSDADGTPLRYSARIGAQVRAHYVDSKSGLDTWSTHYYLAPVTAEGPDWSRAEAIPEPGPRLADQPVDGATYDDAPAAVLSSRSHKRWASSLEDHVYRNVAVELLSCPALKATSAPGVSEGEFRAQLAVTLREKRDAGVEALRRRFASKLDALEDRARRAAQKVEREKAQASSQTLSSALSVGGSLLGALFGGGRRGSSISKASTAARSLGKAGRERAEVGLAQADERALREQITAIETELEDEVTRIESGFDPQSIQVERVPVKPRKADLAVEQLALVWHP
jgi:hypothetical protein